MLAPKHEKAFHRGVEALAAGDLAAAKTHFEESSQRDDRDKAIGDDLMAGLACLAAGDDQAAVAHLEKVVSSDVELPDELITKYASQIVIGMTIAPHVRVEVAPDSLGAALALVECYQATGRSEEAIGLLQRMLDELPGLPELTLSLADLLHEQESWAELVELGAGVENTDDATFAVRLLQASALAKVNQPEAALEVYRALLRTKKRAPALVTEARYGRGTMLLSLGKAAQGRKDLAAIFAEDPGFRDVAELLNAGG